MKTDAEFVSENASAAGEAVGQGEAREPTAASPPGSEAATSADAATDEAPAKAEIAKTVEPSVDSGKTSPTGGTGESNRATGIARADNPVGESPVAIASTGAAEIDPLGDALAALERRDYATAQRLFEALGRKDAAQAITDALAALDRSDYAAAQGLFDALSLKGSAAARATRPATAKPAPARLAALAAVPSASDSRDRARPKSGASPLEVIPAADVAYRRPPAAERRARGLRPVLFGAGLVIAAIFGASALYGSPLNWTLASMKGQTIAALASAVHVLDAPLQAIANPSGREEQRSAIGDLRAALTQVTIRLDRIEQEYGARLDKLSAPVDQDSSATSAETAARLERLEKKAAAPAAPGLEIADVVARLDKLEKRVPAAAAPASELADIATRLARLEKTAAMPAATAVESLPPGASRQSTLLARAEPSASNDIAGRDNTKPLLRNYSVEDVQDGIAVVDSRYGAQQVGPGDFIPGAGRVLRIERRGRDWFVVTSQGVIAGGPGPY